MDTESLLSNIIKNFFEKLDKRIIKVLKDCKCITKTNELAFENCQLYYVTKPLKIFDLIDIVVPLILKETNNKTILETLKVQINKESPLAGLLTSNIVVITEENKFQKFKKVITILTKLTLIEIIKRYHECEYKEEEEEKDDLKNLLVKEYSQRKKNV